MDKKRIGAKEKDMKLADWLANNIIYDHVDVDTVEDFIVSGNVQQLLEANTTSTSVNKKNQFFGLELLGALLSLINPNKK